MLITDRASPARIFRLLEAGKSVEAVADVIGCTPTGLYLWLRRDQKVRWDAFRKARKRRRARIRNRRYRDKRRAAELLAYLADVPQRYESLRRSQRELVERHGFNPAQFGMQPVSKRTRDG